MTCLRHVALRCRDMEASRRFYERLGGRPVGERTSTVGVQRLDEVAYGWDELGALLG